MKNNLSELFKIQKVLKASGYYDISRIGNDILEFSKKRNLDDILLRIKSGEPWEYIKEKGEFRDKEFSLNRYTLIPRIETEQIVDIAKEVLKDSPTPFTDIVDVGTGSGCIIISLASELDVNKIKFFATDISKEALDIAKINEIGILAKHVIEWKQTNLLEELSFSQKSNVLIIANLPYIPTQQYLKLDKSVKDFEPRLALDGGKNGIHLYEELFKQVDQKHLHCTVVLEIEPSTLPLFEDYKPTIIKDIYDRDRFLIISFN